MNVGTNGGSSYTLPSTVPSRSDTRLVNSTIYDDAGRAWKLTDPRGLEARRTYDLMGRTTKTVENYVNGTPSDTDDKTVDYVFWGPRLLYTLTAQLTSGSQETKYIYGVSSSDGSTIASNDLLRATYWPNKSTGAASSSEDELSSYNALGQRITFEDRNGNIHAYSFDVVGRPTADAVTTVGSGVDGGIQRIETAYDPAGRAYLFTSYDDDSGGSVVNQVQRDFNGLGQITKEYQAHGGAVNTGTSPKVQYTYSEMASSANHSRLTSMIYPDGFTIGYNYASGVDTAISRLTSMTNSSTTLEALSYFGLGTVVARTHPESGVDLTYIGTGPGEGGDQYVGLDRFGRIIDQRWKTTSTDKDRYLYGYDRNSNRLYRTNELDHTFDELYHADGASNGYDGLNQLSEFQRGTLSDTNSDTIPDTVSASSRYQTWDPDALGNFEGVNTDGTNQSRTHNKQNQSTVVGGNTLVFDNNGNTTTDETGRTFGWDAWNRLVKVNGTTRYAVDALGRRIKEGSTDFYYTTNWQMIEEQVSGTTTSHFVWSPVYVDALVLRERDLAKPAGVMDERLYVMQDANFNVTALINTSGTVVERYVQDPYGRFDVKDASWGVRASSSYAWVYLHQGGRWDATSALFSFRYRDHSPTLMRWVSVDPIGFRSRDVDLYRYETNMPNQRLDPDGLYILWPRIIRGIIFPPQTPPEPPRNYHCPFGEAVECERRLGVAACARTKEIADEAETVANATGLPGRSSGARDAFRHCYASCRVTGDLGSNIAAIVGDIHEYCTPENMPWHPEYDNNKGNWAMDAHNNAQGRDCGKNIDRCDSQQLRMKLCASCCARKLKEGALVLSPDPKAGPPSNTAGPPQQFPPPWRGPKPL